MIVSGGLVAAGRSRASASVARCSPGCSSARSASPSTAWRRRERLFLIGVPLQALWGLDGPAAQGLMTRRVDASEQGQLQGALSSLRGIAGLIGPGLFTLTFAHFIGPGSGLQLPGAPFLLAAALLASALADRLEHDAGARLGSVGRGAAPLRGAGPRAPGHARARMRAGRITGAARSSTRCRPSIRGLQTHLRVAPADPAFCRLLRGPVHATTLCWLQRCGLDRARLRPGVGTMLKRRGDGTCCGCAA